MLQLLPGLVKGLMIIGTPPALGEEQVLQGFNSRPPRLAAAEYLTDEQMDALAHGGTGGPYESWMKDYVVRTDGKARRILWAGLTDGVGLDQRAAVEQSDVLIAVVNGADDTRINIDYIDGIKWRNLWEGKCMRLEGLQHAPFWEKPEVFNPVLERFMKACS